MYIPRPAKLLFQHDEGWNHFLEKYGASISDWTKLSVERLLAGLHPLTLSARAASQKPAVPAE